MYEELDFQRTALGDLILRRRSSVSQQGAIVYEVTLDGEFLMSSVVNQSEIALTHLGLAALGRPAREVMVAGLGLGHTAAAVLEHPEVEHLTVVELLAPVLDWHRERLVPLGELLSTDPRCRLLQADFFQLVGQPREAHGPLHDAILVDIDHSPEALLHPSHAGFYARGGLRSLASHLSPGGVLGYWSADPPPPSFLDALREVFRSVEVHTVEFYSPFLGEEDSNTVLIAQLA
jgi:spermidine synthase